MRMADKLEKKPEKKSGLGRGLNALLDGPYDAKKDLAVSRVNTITGIAVGLIDTNPFQPRARFDADAMQELAESIRQQGIIQPITVRQLGPNQFQLISGERRLQASRLAGLETIPAYVRKADDQQMLELALIENIQRENLNAIEIALSFQRLVSECNLKQEELGERVGKKRTTVTNYLRLLKLPPDIQIGLRDNKITMGHARALVNIETVEQQLAVFRRVVDEDLSVRRVEEIARDLTKPVKRKDPVDVDPADRTELHEDLRHLETRLRSHFGTRIDVRSNQSGKGEIKIPFASVEELNRILEMIQVG